MNRAVVKVYNTARETTAFPSSTMLSDLPPLDLGLLAELDGAPDAEVALTSMSGNRGLGCSDLRTGVYDILPVTPRTANSQRYGTAQRDGEKPFDTGIRTPTIGNTVRNTPAASSVSMASARQGVFQTVSGLLPRDALALHTIVRLRLASMQQIAALVYPERSLVVARRRLRSLEKRGWVTFWDRPSSRGAAIRYALPTPRAIALAHAAFDAFAPSTGFEPLLRRMLPTRPRRLTTIPPGEIPPWFSHQDEINRLLVAIAAADGERLAWYSSWDCPFPDRVNGLKAPQPDYVLVRTTANGYAVTLGEHDRASEPLARWSEKIAAYAVAMELAREWLGIERFTVDVTVVDPSPRDPMQRLRELLDLAWTHGAASFMRFTLAGWLHAAPNAAIWFVDHATPAGNARSRQAHLDRLVA